MPQEEWATFHRGAIAKREAEIIVEERKGRRCKPEALKRLLASARMVRGYAWSGQSTTSFAGYAESGVSGLRIVRILYAKPDPRTPFDAWSRIASDACARIATDAVATRPAHVIGRSDAKARPAHAVGPSHARALTHAPHRHCGGGGG